MSATLEDALTPIPSVVVETDATETDVTDGENLRLSATQVKMYLTCPRQYRYKYIEGLPTVTTGALAFGKTIHQVLHDLHQWSIYSGEPLSESVALVNFARLWEKIVCEQEPLFKSEGEIAEYSRLAELMLIGYVESERERPSPLVTEFPFEIALRDEKSGKDYTLRGVIDRIDQENNGLTIVDYKSGKRKPSARELAFDVQLTIYAYAAKEVFGQEIVEMQLHHLRDQTIFHTYRGAADERTLFKVTLPLVVAGITEKRFAPHTGYWCRFCDFREQCQAEGPDNVP